MTFQLAQSKRQMAKIDSELSKPVAEVKLVKSATSTTLPDLTGDSAAGSNASSYVF